MKWERPMLRLGNPPSRHPSSGASRSSASPEAFGGCASPGPGVVAPSASLPPSSTTCFAPSTPDGASHAVPHERSSAIRGCPVSGWSTTSFQIQVSVSMTAESYLLGPATSTLFPPAPSAEVLGSTKRWG